MKLVIVSDTHRDFYALSDIVEKNRDADLFIHLGDGEREYEDIRCVHPEFAYLYVRGNNDWGMYPPNNTISLCGHKLYMCHGHSFDRSSLKSFLAATASVNGCDIALFGHTHVMCDETVDGIRLINPGSPSCPRGGNPCTYGVMILTDDGSISFEHKTI